MNDINFINNKKQAEKIVKELLEIFQWTNYTITPLSIGSYNFNFRIKEIKSSVNVIVYYGSKGTKVVLQGNPNTKLYKEVSEKLSKDSKFKQYKVTNENQTFDFEEPESYIGVDESGKGDFFGPLIIAGFFIHPDIKKELIHLQVQDSKKLTDEKVIKLANEIKLRFADYFNVVQIYPKKYNELYEKIKNLNTLLAWGHARCIENILNKHKVSLAICDKFGNEKYIKNALMKEGKQIDLIQTTNAERYIGVAAASILARNSFLEWLKRTEEKLGIKIPKGSNQKVKEVAKLIVKFHGRDALLNYVKIHFKTMNEI